MRRVDKTGRCYLLQWIRNYLATIASHVKILVNFGRVVMDKKVLRLYRPIAGCRSLLSSSKPPDPELNGPNSSRQRLLCRKTIPSMVSPGFTLMFGAFILTSYESICPHSVSQSVQPSSHKKLTVLFRTYVQWLEKGYSLKIKKHDLTNLIFRFSYFNLP